MDTTQKKNKSNYIKDEEIEIIVVGGRINYIIEKREAKIEQDGGEDKHRE